jgi:hypothetical protein
MEDENNQMIACNLGADFTAEHEWGIKELYQTLGVKNDKNVMGIDRYRICEPKMDNIVLIEENKNNVALICLHYQCDMKYLVGQTLDKMFHGELTMRGESELATAWDGKSFGIRVKRPVNIKRIKRLYDTIKNKEAAIWLGGGGVFQNAGLVIGLINAIPENLKQQMYEAHVDTKKLYDASDKTGIKAKIDALNEAHQKKYKDDFNTYWRTPFGYYSLKPGWISDKSKSDYPVIYWLNPREQEKNQSGWYTVEQLEQWIEGKGPVVEKKEKQFA